MVGMFLNMLFQAPATIQGLRTLADNTIRMAVDFQEMSAEEMGGMFTLKGKLGWFLFKENEIQEIEIPKESVKIEGEKSPSKRLHDRMFALYASNHEDKSGFRSWYADQLDKIGQQFLDKIES